MSTNPVRKFQAQVVDTRLTATLDLPGTGSFSVTARARDVAGNWAERSFTLTVDVTAPTASISPPAAWTRVRDIVVGGSANDAHSGMNARRIGESLAGAPWVDAANGAYTSPITLSDGDARKSILGEFRDNAGNVASRSATIILDTRGPNISAVSPTPDSSGNSIVNLEVKGSWTDDQTITPFVSGVDRTAVQIFWYDGATGQTTDVSADAKMSITDTGFTFRPIVIPGGTFYQVIVHKQDRAGNAASLDWGFWTA